jgi:large subunit ribosomal protein L23
MRDPREVIIRPVVTERSTELQEDERTYTFIVSRESNKAEIRNAVQKLFGVNVEDVRTANYRGKWRRVGRTLGKRPAYKKAMVKLVDGDAIDVYEGI